jgi:HD-like signal output (HDOD) protein
MTHEKFDTFTELQSFLVSQMNERGDLPGFSRSVQSIVNVLADASEEDRDDLKLIQVVLTDASLTQKVLRLANSAMYAVFEGQVTTVSRAIAILGIQTVAHLALGLKVVESFQSEDKTSVSIKGEMQKSMLAGVIGRQFASCSASTRDAEEASVCAVLHGLGRMLVAFYLPEAWAAIDSAVKRGIAPETAAEQVLSVGFEQVGQFIASRWGLPSKLVSALRSASSYEEGTPLTHEDWLCTVGTAATRGASILYESHDESSAAITQLVTTFAPRLGLEVSQLRDAIASARTIIEETMSATPAVEKANGQSRDRALARGLEELKSAAKTSTLSQTVALAVEFLHQTLGSNRSYYFLKATKERMYKARLGLGKGAVELLPSLKFEEQFKPDVFHAAMASEKSCYVENTKSDNIKYRLPMWWLASLGTAQSFCIVPMNSNRIPLGFIYLEWASASQSKKLEGYALEVLSEVRTVIAQSIERSRLNNAMAMHPVPA